MYLFEFTTDPLKVVNTPFSLTKTFKNYEGKKLFLIPGR